jgi:transcriptional regulator with PAS, ATPase and Fis domain
LTDFLPSYTKNNPNRNTGYQVCVVSSGPDHKKTLTVTQADGVVGIGTDPGNHLVLTDKYVSGFQFQLEIKEKGVQINVLGTTNFTSVDGKRCEGKDGNPIRSAQLVSGEETEIVIGETRLRLLLGKRPYWEKLVGESPRMVATYGQIQIAAESDANVLILGKTGVGKEVAAELIHWLSPRFKGPYITINCAAIPQHLIESELFGYMKGAHATAWSDKSGCFERADGGAIFLDEIGELSLEHQPKLLRVLQERKVRRIGGDETLCNFRVITATNRDLPDAIREGKFREDLFHRLNLLTVSVPSLCDRKEDVVDLAKHFLQTTSVKVTSEAIKALEAHSWPGNIRELYGALEKAVGKVKSRGGDAITRTDIELMEPITSTDKQGLDEKNQIQKVIDDCLLKYNGNRKLAIKEAAERLDMGISTLYNKIKQFGLN